MIRIYITRKKNKSYEMKRKPLHNENPHIKHSNGPKYEPKHEKKNGEGR